MNPGNVQQKSAARRGGRHWVVTAIGMPIVAVSWWYVYRLNVQFNQCFAEHGPDSADEIDGVAGPCHSLLLSGGILSLALLAALAVTLIVGLVLGVIDGRRRRRFAYGRWVCVVVVGLTGPWALLAYALAYGLGRLLPAYRPPARRPQDSAGQRGWIEAIHLYQRLTAGEPPPVVYSPDFIGPGVVYLDAPFNYSRYYGTTVTYEQSSTFAYGRPAFVVGAVVGDLIGNSVARSRAASFAQPQWRDFAYARVIVTPTTTWCCLGGLWLAFDHDMVMGYSVDGMNALLTFPDVEPLRLGGPSVWCHAVMFAYARFGPDHWQTAPFLHPVREAVGSLAQERRPTAPGSD